MTNLVQFPGLGLSFEINRVALSIGGFNIYWYGVCIAFGICLALVFAFRHSIEFGVDPDSMVDVILIGIVLGIVSARAYYVAMAPFKYESIWEMIAIRDGGLAIYGGIIGGFLFGGLACKRRGVPVLPMFDLTAMGFLLGQGCGRWGNFFNQEAFGCNTTLPWGMFSETTRAYLMGSTVTAQNIDELNELGHALLEVRDKGGLETFEAALVLGNHTRSVKDLINLTQNLDLYRFYPDISDDEGLGRLYADELGTIDIPEHIQNYFDYEAYGRDVRINEGGVFAPGGYVSAVPEGFKEYYHGPQDIPPEHRIFAYPEKAEPVHSILAALKRFQEAPPAPKKDKAGPSHEER